MPVSQMLFIQRFHPIIMSSQVPSDTHRSKADASSFSLRETSAMKVSPFFPRVSEHSEAFFSSESPARLPLWLIPELCFSPKSFSCWHSDVISPSSACRHGHLGTVARGSLWLDVENQPVLYCYRAIPMFLCCVFCPIVWARWPSVVISRTA